MDLLGFDPGTPAPIRRRVVIVVAAAVLAISSSAVLVRGMSADPLAIAAWRTLGASVLLAPAVVAGRARLSAADLLRIVAAGLLLGLHFWAWFESVQSTTVLRSTLLVCLVPGWTALAEWALFGTRPTRAHWLGLAIALPGLLLLAGAPERAASPVGDALALLAGVFGAAYFLIGRRVRQRVPVGTYMGLVCLTATATLFPLAALGGVPLVGFPPGTWGLLVLAVLGPQLIGHQGLTWAMRWVPATTISTVTLLEPVGAALLAAVFLSERPGPFAALGAALVLVGIAVATRPREPAAG